MRRTSQKWYNMQYINMSGNLPMGIAGNLPRVRYSAAYPTGRELGLRRGNYCVTLTVSEGSDPKNTDPKNTRKGFSRVEVDLT